VFSTYVGRHTISKRRWKQCTGADRRCIGKSRPKADGDAHHCCNVYNHTFYIPAGFNLEWWFDSIGIKKAMFVVGNEVEI